MKPVSIHPLSALAGASLLGLLLLSSSTVQVHGGVQRLPACSTEPGPPRNLVVIREGEIYVVPSGRRLVVTAFGSASPTVASVQLVVDGIPEVTTHTETPTTMREVPRWLVVSAGSAVAVNLVGAAPDDCRAWGYLVDA